MDWESQGRYNGHKDFHKAIANTTNNLHKELDLMFQVEAETTKAEIRITQNMMEAMIEVT